MAKTTPKASVQEFTHLRFDVDADGVATVLLDVRGERMNTLSRKVEDDLRRVVERLEGDDSIKAVVIGSGKPDNFLAGADIEMLKSLDSAEAGTAGAKALQEAYARIEKLHSERGKPVVAAIHGPALGGGLELALACSMRIASDSPKTTLGQPEVQIGVLPGAGGTQRLPRRVGIATGLDLILTGRSVRPKQALKMRLVDEIVPAAILLEVARKRAKEAAAGKVRAPKKRRFSDVAREVALEDNPAGRAMLFRQARVQLLKKTRGNYPAPEKALEAVHVGIAKGLAAGYEAERKLFGELIVTPEAKALMSIFFATQDLKKDSGVDDPKVEARPVRRVGVLGGGLMGGGIATMSLTNAGVPVRIKEVDDAAVGRGLAHVHGQVQKDVERGRRTEPEADRLLYGLTGTTDLSGFHGIDLVIEAVFEDLELKRKILRDLEAATAPETIFASNTSSLPITKIAEASKHPETVIGMHYFSPVEKMPLLEVIVTKKTAPWVTATCVAFGKAQGKTVIVVRDGTGFYTSRILGPYMNEAAWVLHEGGAVEDIDEAMMDFGFPVGPITLLDEVGIDVAAKVGHIVEKEFGARVQAPGTLDGLTKDDRKGRKNGRGFYVYEKGKGGQFEKKDEVDPTVYSAFGQTADRKKIDKGRTQQRLALAMVNEAARCLEEGILRSARDGDVGAIFGLGFPPFLGGPFSWIDRLGAAEVVRRLDAFAKELGSRFEPAKVLRDAAKAGKSFRSAP